MLTNKLQICTVCESNKLIPVIDLGMQPLCDDLIPVGSNAECVRYKTEMVMCEKCFTVLQAFPVKKEVLFPKNYHYRARFTKDVLNGMEDFVRSGKRVYGNLNNKKVLDIGCNDGSLLNFFKKENCITTGIEPTDAAVDAKGSGHSILQEFFSQESAKTYIQMYGKPDIITFTNVFAHIEDLNETLLALKILIHDEIIIVIENHYLLSILEKFQFDTFYHEHPRTYSLESFKIIAEKLDLMVTDVDFPGRYGGNIRVYLSKKIQNKKINKEEENLQDLILKIKNMNLFLENWKRDGQIQIEKLTKNSFLFGKSFPGRISILLSILNITNDQLLIVYEKPNSLKIGNYIPGTRIPILSDIDIPKKSGEMNLLILGWHIEKELVQYMKDLNFKGKIFSIMPNFREII